jgi:uncharacterized protein
VTGNSLDVLLGPGPERWVGTTSSSPYSGSPTFDEVPFHVVGVTPILGTYVVIKNGCDDYVHYGRIIQGQEDNARADPAALQQNRAYQVGEREPRPGDLAPHVTRILRIQILGELSLDAGKLAVRDPKELPQTGRGVYTLGADTLPDILGLPNDPDAGLDLGTFASGGKTVTIRLPLEALARHINIVGKPGVGKSHAGGVLVEECVRLGIPVIAFDVLNDLGNATEALHGKRFIAGTPEFRIPFSVIGLSEFLAFIPNLTREQQEIVAAAYDAVHTEAFEQLEAVGHIDIGLDRLTAEIEAVGAATGQPAVATRAGRRITALFHRSSLLTSQTQDWLEQLKVQPVVNIYVGHLPQRQRNLVVAGVARMLQILRRKQAIPPFVLLLDESHLFLAAGGDATPSVPVIREMVRTARHDGIGIVLITQSPASMARQSFLICNTRLVFALDPEDLRLVGGHLSDLPETVIDRIPRMRRGRAILSSAMDVLRHSVELDVRERETPGGAPTPNLAKEAAAWRRKTRG